MQNNDPSEQVLNIIKWAMIGSVGLYIAIGLAMIKEPTSVTIQEAISNPVILALSILGLIALIVGRKVPQLIKQGTGENTKTTQVIIELAVYESAALFGLVLTILEQSHQFILAFGIASILQQVRVSVK